jgi:hypothetical protein
MGRNIGAHQMQVIGERGKNILSNGESTISEPMELTYPNPLTKRVHTLKDQQVAWDMENLKQAIQFQLE